MSQLHLEALGEALQSTIKNRRVHTAVFTTFEFDPAFFEQEILPTVLDGAYSHASAVRLVQLEDLLRSLPGGIAVFYDAARLAIGDSGSSRLDVRRIPIRHTKGVFHPKNVFLLVEAGEPDEEGHRARSLIVACTSANITRAGWWSNLEVGHIEEIPEGDKTCLRDDLLAFLSDLQKAAGGRAPAIPEIAEIVGFLKKTEQRQHRTSNGWLMPQFFHGRSNVVDFLDSAAGDLLQGTYLEVISPYFDEAPTCRALDDLIQRFNPKQVRVFLPRNDSGEALCRPDFFDSVCQHENVQWGRLAGDLLGMGRGEAVKKRFVHAKVYRFFSKNPSREYCFVGSVNLTRPAHERGNIESGFLVELEARKPDFWMEAEPSKVKAFAEDIDDPLAEADEGYCPIDVRFNWQEGAGFVYWDAKESPSSIQLFSRGVGLGAVQITATKVWIALDKDLSSALKESVTESSLIEVMIDGKPPARVLVQEEGMSHKPSLLRTLSAAEILKYWSLLTPQQRAAFIADRITEVKSLGLGDDLTIPLDSMIEKDTVFDRFAGIFHAFGCLEREVTKALVEGNEKIADYRVFGMKYDSLGSLLQRLEPGAPSAGDETVESYVTLLCARQLLQAIKRAHPDYWSLRQEDVRRLDEQMERLAPLRQRLIDTGPEDLPHFLKWFDHWFLKRAHGPALEVHE